MLVFPGCRHRPISQGLQRELQRKRETIHYWCRTSSGESRWLGNKHERWGFMFRPGVTRHKKWRREIRAELSNLWGNGWSLEVHQPTQTPHDISTWRLQHDVCSECQLLLLLHLIYCYSTKIIAMVGARPQTELRPAPSEADTETESVSGQGRGRVRSVMSSQFYEKFKRADDELISSHQSQLMIEGMKEGILCQISIF